MNKNIWLEKNRQRKNKVTPQISILIHLSLISIKYQLTSFCTFYTKSSDQHDSTTLLKPTFHSHKTYWDPIGATARGVIAVFIPVPDEGLVAASLNHHLCGGAIDGQRTHRSIMQVYLSSSTLCIFIHGVIHLVPRCLTQSYTTFLK